MVNRDINQRVFYEGIKFYIRQLLFNRSKFKYLKMFVENRCRRSVRRKRLGVDLVYSVPLSSYMYLHSIRSHIYAGFYERGILRYLKRKVREYERCLFVDVGAYAGYYSILMAKGGCEVIAFEPDPRNVVLLMNNIAMNGVEDRIKVFNAAVCDKDGSRIPLKLSKSPSESSLTNYLRRELVECVIPVQCVTLDSVLLNTQLHAGCVVMKVDVEGAALRVIKGGMLTITKFKPYIILEVHRTFSSEDELLVLNALRKHGYMWRVLEWRSSKNFIVALEPTRRQSPGERLFTPSSLWLTGG